MRSVIDTIKERMQGSERWLRSESTANMLFKLIQEVAVPTVVGKVFMTQEEATEVVDCCEEILRECDTGKITKLYEMLGRDFDVFDKLRFFQGIVNGKTYGDLDFSEFPPDLLQRIVVADCTFGKVKISTPLSELLGYKITLADENMNNRFEAIELSDLSLESWKTLDFRNKRLGSVTFKSLLYLELGMRCNCKCSFCRNQSFKGKCKIRDFNRVLRSLEVMYPYIDEIFIGGGEPSLYIDDIIKLKRRVRDLVVVTNGTIDSEMVYKLGREHIKFYISRHAISDEENLSILRPNRNSQILSMDDIGEIIRKFCLDFNFDKSVITLTPVCIKGGLDSSQKISEYISMAFFYGINDVLISTLQEDASMGEKGIDYKDLYVNPSVFDEVFSLLLSQGFQKKRRICSTGGYILERFTKYDFTVSFKIYISKDKFPGYWKSCLKRTFDFTMTPTGDVYQDWCRGTMVDLEELKRFN